MSDENISQNTISEFNSFIDPELLSQSVLDTSDNISTFAQSDSQAIFEPKRKDRKSFIWLPENGEEYLKKGKWRWRCCRCPVKRLAPTFSDTSTRNALDHLLKVHHVTKENPLGGLP